jgi:hypothetical protein
MRQYGDVIPIQRLSWPNLHSPAPSLFQDEPPTRRAKQIWSVEPQEHSRCKLSNDWTMPGWYLDTYSDSHEAFMSRRDFSGQQWLMSVQLLATSGFYSTQSVPTDVPASIYHNDGNSQGPQNPS